jgi:hypothetical protein
MVNNSTNINKTDNRLSLSPQTIAHNKDHIFDMKLEIQVIGTDCICSCKSNYHAIAYYRWRCNQEGEGWDPINLFKPTTFLGQPRARTWISNFISNMWSLLWAMVWGDSDRRLSVLLILVELLTMRSHGSWIYNYICNQFLSPLTLWVWILLIAKCTHYNVVW